MSEIFDANAQCIVCKESSDAVPIVAFRYRGAVRHICSQHLPILIHRPGELADKLPGAQGLDQGECDH